MLLARQLTALAIRQPPNVLRQLSSAFSSLSVTPPLLQQQKHQKTDYSTASKPAVAQQQLKQANATTGTEQEQCQAVFSKINEQLKAQNEGRLFGVVHLCGKQFKVTAGDIILVEGYWPPTIGDEIRLEKVLLAGGRDFTLIGRPVLEPGLVNIKATIIEKTLTHTKTHFKKKRRKQYWRINFQRSPNTMLRINSIEINANRVEQSASQSTTIDPKRLF